MAEDANARIRVDIDTAEALANIKNLQRQISAFHTSMAKGGAAAAASSLNLQQNLLNSINKTGQFSATIKNVKTTTDSFTSALEKNKLSMGEYFRYSGAATKTFGKLFRTEFDTINKVARERVKDLQTQYIKMGRDANGAMQAIAVRPLALDMKNLGTQTQIAAQRQALLNQMLKQGSTNLLNFGKNTQWAGRQLMVGFTIPLVMFGSVASKTFMDMEKQAIRFKRVYGEMFTTTAETTKALEEIKSLANEFTKYGVAVAKTMELAADIAATGKMGADLTAQVAQATRLAVLGGVEQAEALKATISLTDAFGVAAEQLAGKIDFLNAVENQTVTSIEDLTIAIPKAGPVVQQLGGDVKDLTFFLTAMREGGINASEGANALKSGLASLINPTTKASEMLQGFGINIKGIVDANKGNVKGIVIDFAKALDTLDPLNRAQAIEQLFGKFQFARLSTLFQNVIKEGNQANRVLKLTNATTEELAILSERELKKVEDSPMFKFQKAVEDIKVTLVPLGEAFLKAVTPVLEFGTKILEKFNELDAGAKQFVVGLTAIAGVIGPVFLMGFGLIANGVANVIKGFVFFKTAMNKAGSASSQLGMQTEYMTQQQLEASAVAASLDQIHTKLTQTFTSEASAINNLTASYNRSIAAQALMTGGAIKRTRPAKKYASGVLSVPGPKGAGDVVPAMLSPGEAIIPAKQASKYSGFISSMISDNIPGFMGGRNPISQLGSMVRAPGVKHGILEGILRLLTGNRQGTYGSEQNFYKDSVAKNFMRSSPKVAVRMQDEDLIKLINSKDKRYKSLFETQTSRAMDTPDKRAFAENKLFGFDENMDPRMRPVYGYMFKQERNLRNKSKNLPFNLFEAITGKKRTMYNRSGVKEQFNRTTGSLMNPKTFTYGNTAMVLKNRNIKDRTTFTYGDSYNAANERFATPARLGSRSSQSYNAAKTSLDKDFFEAQILGGFTLRDVKKIIVTQPELIPQLQSVLRAQGIKIPVGMPRFTMLQRLRKILSRGKLGPEALPTIQPSGAYSNIPFGKKVPGYANGIFSVPGPKGAGDIMPSMLSPGEAVIPAKPAKKYASLIQSMIADNIPGFEKSNVKKKSGMVVKDVKLKSSTGTSAATPKARTAAPKITPPDTITGYTDFVTALSKGANSDLNLRKANPKALAAEFRSAGSMGMSPVVDAMLEAMGSKGQRQIKKDIESNPQLAKNLKGFATDLSSGIANELDKVPDALMGDPKLSSIANKVGKATAKKFGPEFEKAFKTVQQTPTVALDDTRERINSKNKARASERINLMSGNSGYIGKGMKRFTKTGNLLGLTGNIAPDAVMAHLSESKQVSLSELEKTSTLSPSAQEAKSKKLSGMKQVHREGQAQKKVMVPAGYTAKQSIAELEKVQDVQKENIKAEEKVVKQKAKVVKEDTKTTNTKAATVKVEKQTQADTKKADAARKGWETRRAKTPIPASTTASEPAKRRMGMGLGTAGMVASGAVMAGSMVPGQVGEISQQLMMPVMLLSMLAPMLSNPVLLAATAIGGLAVAAFMLDQQFKENIKKSYELTTAMGSGSKAIRPFAEAAGNVTAGEIMDKRRQGELSPLQIKPGKTTFGQTFVQSEAGQSLKTTIGETAKELGREGVISKLVSQMATAVATQALSPQQARSVVAQLAQEMGDIGLGMEVNARLISLLGPNGENLLTSPLEIRTKLIEESVSNISLGGTKQRGGRGYITSKPVASAGQIGSFAANSVMALQQQKELVDSLQIEYEERIKNAKASGDLAKVSELENKYQEDRQAILEKNAGTVKKIQEQLSAAGNQRQVLDAFGNQIKAMFSDNVSVSGMLPDLFKNLDKINDQEEIILRAEILAENLNPIALNNMLSDEALAPKVVPIIAKFGGTQANRIFQLAELMGKQESLEFLVDIKGMDVTEMNKYVTGLQKIYNLSAFTGQSEVIINAYVNSDTLLDDFNAQMDALRKAAGDKPITTTMIQKLVTEGTVQKSVLDAIKSDQTYFDSLPKEQKLTYVQAITVSANLEGNAAVQKLFQAWQLQKGGKFLDSAGGIVGGGTFAEYLAQAIGKPVTDGGIDDTGGTNKKITGNNGGGGRKSSPLDGILKALQNVRKASINALGKSTELFKLFEKGKNISVFKGIENQLLTLTSNTDFASFIAGLDKKEQDLFITVKKGNVELTKRGRLLEKGYRAKIVGDFVLSQQKLGVASKDELTARNLLIKAGYSYVEAVELSRDADVAAAYASAAATDGAVARKKAIEDVDNALRKGLAAQKATLTAEEEFGELYDKIQGKLDADKTAIELKFKIDTAADDKIIRDAENKIAGIQYKLDDQEAGLTLISDKEEVINEKYDKRLEALDKIKAVNDNIAQQQRNQLSLADALSSGDIGAAASAMQQIQQDFVTGSSAKQEDLIEKARQQELLRVSVLVNGELKTREQIEKTIKDLQKEIFELEESGLEPAQERNRLLIAARDEALLKLDQESDKWLAVQTSIEKAKFATLDYAQALKDANALAVSAVKQIESGNPVVAPATPTGTPAANAPAANTPPKEKSLNLADMARRVYRGEYGNGQARTKKLMAEGYTKAQIDKIQDEVNRRYYATGGMVKGYAAGGMIGKYMAGGGFPGMPKRGTDTIPAMLTPGEFVIRKQAVQNFGVDNLESINSGKSLRDSVYNYSVNVNVKTDADASQIAKTVMTQIKQIDSQRIRGVGLR